MQPMPTFCVRDSVVLKPVVWAKPSYLNRYSSLIQSSFSQTLSSENVRPPLTICIYIYCEMIPLHVKTLIFLLFGDIFQHIYMYMYMYIYIYIYM